MAHDDPTQEQVESWEYIRLLVDSRRPGDYHKGQILKAPIDCRKYGLWFLEEATVDEYYQQKHSWKPAWLYAGVGHRAQIVGKFLKDWAFRLGVMILFIAMLLGIAALVCFIVYLLGLGFMTWWG